MLRWKVVGGADKGGILVRDGPDLTSSKCAERLSTGAIITQVQLLDERLHYKLVEGSGPREGWVSLRISGKDLLVPAPIDPSERRRLAAAAAEARAGERSFGTNKSVTGAPVQLAETTKSMTGLTETEKVNQQMLGEFAQPASPSVPAGGLGEREPDLDELLQEIYGVSKELTEDSTLEKLHNKGNLEQQVVEINMEEAFEEAGNVVQAQAAAKANLKSPPTKAQSSVGESVLRVRLLDGKTVISVAVRNPDASVHLLQTWLQKRQAEEAVRAGWPPELIAEAQKGDWAVMNRSAFPPKELADESKTLAAEDLSHGGQLSLVRAAGRGEVRQASHRDTLLWRGYHGMGGKDWKRVREDAQKRYTSQETPVTPWRLRLAPGEEGLVKGALVGKYTIFDHDGDKHKFQKAGMVIVCHAPSAEAAKECHEFALQLNFMVFSFPLLTYGMPEEEHLCAEALVLHKVFEWFQEQTSLMIIRAVVGMGLGCAPAIMQYSGFFQREVRTVALLLGPSEKGSSVSCTWSDRERLLDQKVFIIYVEDHALEHSVTNLRAILPSKVLAERRLTGSPTRLWPSQAAAALNDCLEGARRLDEEYSATAIIGSK